jgi:hypothetical protein
MLASMLLEPVVVLKIAAVREITQTHGNLRKESVAIVLMENPSPLPTVPDSEN